MTSRYCYLAGAVALLAGCEAMTDFDPQALTEGGDATCSDGVDNDGDGLEDCQDIDCYGSRACCDHRAVLLSDTFGNEPDCAGDGCAAAVDDATCARPDPDLWSTWGDPEPVVCGGALWPRKAEACYQIGALSHAEFPLQSGLTVSAGIAGLPEPKGGLELGLTFQGGVVGSSDPCAPIEGATPFLSLRQVATSAGYQLVARFDDRDLGASPAISDDARHEIQVTVTDAGQIEYALDGVPFALSPEGEPVTSVSRPAHLLVAGRGLATRFTDVTVAAASQCEVPDGWQTADPFIALTGHYDDDLAWDEYEVMDPLVIQNAEDPSVLDLYYTGCSPPTTGLRCNIGHATSTAGAPFVRDPVNPVGEAGAPWQHGPVDPGIFVGVGTNVVLNGTPGSWDEHVASLAAEIDGDHIDVWYVGWNDDDNVPRIGLAQSDDAGTSFTKHPDNPVMTEGPFGAFDDRGVADPAVLFDRERGVYRMWYVADGFLGASTSLGYAVSTDGVHWVKRDQPVLRPEDLGLVSFGRPTVMAGEDGLRMWLHGRWPDDPRSQIFELGNAGRRFDQP